MSYASKGDGGTWTVEVSDAEMRVLDQLLHRVVDHQREVWLALNANMNPFWPKWDEEDAELLTGLLARLCSDDHPPIA